MATYEYEACPVLQRRADLHGSNLGSPIGQPHDFSVVVEEWEAPAYPASHKDAKILDRVTNRVTRVACRWCGAQREVTHGD